MRVNSSGDMLALVAELNCRRIAMITTKLAKRGGGQLTLPKRTMELLTTARRLHHRFSAGDYHHDVAEQDRLRDLCQWLVQQHNVLQGKGEETARFAWDAQALQAKTEMPPRAYQEIMTALGEGVIDDIAKGAEPE